MDKTKLTRRVYELQSHFKVVKWLEDGLTDYTPEAVARIEQIAHLAEQLAEDAYNLAAEMRNDSIKKAGQAGMVVGMMIANAGKQKETKDED